MRYDRDGFPKLKKVSGKTCFADVFITITTLGFDIGKGPKTEVISLSKLTKQVDGLHDTWSSNWLTMEELPDFLNREMVEQGYLEEEVEL